MAKDKAMLNDFAYFAVQEGGIKNSGKGRGETVLVFSDQDPRNPVAGQKGYAASVDGQAGTKYTMEQIGGQLQSGSNSGEYRGEPAVELNRAQDRTKITVLEGNKAVFDWPDVKLQADIMARKQLVGLFGTDNKGFLEAIKSEKFDALVSKIESMIHTVSGAKKGATNNLPDLEAKYTEVLTKQPTGSEVELGQAKAQKIKSSSFRRWRMSRRSRSRRP